MSRRSCRYFLPSFQLLHAVCLPFPFVSCRSFRYLLPLASTLLSCSSCSFFPFNSSISLHPSIRCKTLPFHSLLPSFGFNSFSSRSLLLPFRFNSLLFRSLFPPIVLTLPSSSCTSSLHVKAFMSLLPSFVSTLTCGSFTFSFRFMSFISLPPSFSFNSSFLFVLLFLPFQLVHFIAPIHSLQNSSLPFVTSFLWFQLFFVPFVTFPFRFNSLLFRSLFPPIVLTLPSSSCTSSLHVKAFMSLLPSFVSTLTCGSFTFSFRFMSFISLPPSFSFNSSFLFFLLFLSFQLVHFIAPIHSLQNSSLPFVTSFLSFQNFPPVRLPPPFVSSRSFHVIIPSVWLQVAVSGCFFEFRLPRVLQQCYSFQSTPCSPFSLKPRKIWI